MSTLNNTMKEFTSTLFKHMVLRHRERYLVSIDKRICEAHSEWKDLDEEEKRTIRKNDRYAMKMFKNICGGGGTILCI